MKHTAEKDMTLSQQFGMVTLTNTLRFMLAQGHSFQVTTQESENAIYKEITRFGVFDFETQNGDFKQECCDEIVFCLYKDEETKVRFYNTDCDEFFEHDCFIGFDMITNTLLA